MRFLFWNTYENTNINSVLCNIVVEQKINVITLAEYKSDLNDLIKRLWLNGVIVQQYITAGCERIIALGTEKSVAPNLQDKYYTIQLRPPPVLHRRRPFGSGRAPSAPPGQARR